MKYKGKKLSLEEESFIKFSAYNALIEYEEAWLPVNDRIWNKSQYDIFYIPIKYYGMQEYNDENYFSWIGPEYEKGFGRYISSTGHYLLFYNDNLSYEEQHWQTAKLIALARLHILDDNPDMYYKIDDRDPKLEAFAYFYTCPDIILNECHICTAADIITYCRIPFPYANYKSQNLKEQNMSKAFQHMENILKENFAEFISYVKKQF